MLIVALKLFLAPACVVAVSLAARRWGVTVAGLLGGFPVVGGPILLVVTLVHGRDFGTDAAAGALLGLVAAGVCWIVYAGLARRLPPIVTLLAGWAAFFAGIALLGWLGPPVAAAVVLAALTFELGRVLVPAAPAVAPSDLTLPWWDLPARMVAAMAMVLAVTIAADGLGPTLSGLLATFPVLASVLIAFTHLHRGVAEARVLIRGLLLGFYGFAAFGLVLAVTLRDLGTAASFTLALAAATLVQLAMAARAAPGAVAPGAPRLGKQQR